MLIRQSKVILVSLLISLFTIVSSYYAFFGGVVVLLWYFFNREFKRLSMFVILCVVFTGILNFNLILKNVPFLSGFSENIQAQKIERPIEDWYNFSIKPWYFVIPPKNSTFFSEFSNDIHLRIYNTGYYLAQSYSEDEMGGVFIGWHFALGIIFVLVYFFHKKLNNKFNQYFENLNKNKNLILYCLFSMFVIFLISSPPSITIKGFEIFTPSYLLFQVVPFFRALSRWGIVIFLLVLVINFILYADLLNLIERKFYRIIFYTLIIIINFLMFSVNLNIIDIKDLPPEISFLNQSGSKVYVSIPMDYYSIFWGSYIYPFILENEFEKRPVFKDEVYEIFNPNLQMLKQIDTVVLYKNELNGDEISDIQKINPEIRSLQDVENYLLSNFGNIIFEDEKSKIFSN